MKCQKRIELMERLRIQFGIGKRNWLDILEVPYKAYVKFVLGLDDLPGPALDRVASHFGLDIQELLDGTVDPTELARKHGLRFSLPERYSFAAFGRMRATMTSLDYVEKQSGWRARVSLLKSFHLGESVFDDPFCAISMEFITDLTQKLSERFGYLPRDFYNMGVYSLHWNQHTILSDTFSSVRQPQEIYEMLFGDMLKYFEQQNCHYTLNRLKPDHSEVEVISNRYICEALHKRHLGNQHICHLKAGWMASALGYLGLPHATVSERTCVHRGADSCKFHIDFSGADSALHKRRRSSPYLGEREQPVMRPS